jgi:hypothetical protein
MAKAADKSTTIHWIWLLEALQEAIKVFGSQVLAKRCLKEWLATGQLPWTCMAWEELDEEGLIRPSRGNEPNLGSILSALIQFFAQSLRIDWEDNSAYDLRNGALGIKVSHTHLGALLPDDRPGHDEAPQQTKPAALKLMAPKAWLTGAKKKNPRRQNEDVKAYALRLHALMQEASVAKSWSLNTVRRRLYDKDE